MTTLPTTEAALREAMRDRRHWQPGHPDRERYAARVTEGWRALVEAEAAGTQEVKVRAHTRLRDGREEHVDAYTQTRRSARERQGNPAGDGTILNVADTGTAPAADAPASAPSVVTIFVGGLADATSLIVRDQVALLAPHGPGMATYYLSHGQGRELLHLIEGLPVDTSINVVGFSWGGDTAAQVAAILGSRGRPIDTLLTIDPVGRGTSDSFFRRVKAGAGQWINVHAAGGGTRSLQRGGCDWQSIRHWPEQTRRHLHLRSGRARQIRPDDAHAGRQWADPQRSAS